VRLEVAHGEETARLRVRPIGGYRQKLLNPKS